MKRLGSISASAPELRRLIRSGVLAGAVLILLVSLPDFVPPLAHLLRPSPTCIPGVDCFGEAIKALIWHLRWIFAALGAITILWGAMLALMIRRWCEVDSTDQEKLTSPRGGGNDDVTSDPDSVDGLLSTKDIAARLPGVWTTKASGCAYPTPQRRIRIAIETNGDLEALRYERRNPHTDGEELAQDVLALIGSDLSARDQLALLRVLTARLTDWQLRRGCEDDPVRHCLDELSNRHRQATLNLPAGGELRSEVGHEGISE